MNVKLDEIKWETDQKRLCYRIKKSIFTLAAVDYIEWIFQVRSGIKSQCKSQNPRNPHDNRQFQ